jgi:hypothetical protein
LCVAAIQAPLTCAAERREHLRAPLTSGLISGSLGLFFLVAMKMAKNKLHKAEEEYQACKTKKNKLAVDAARAAFKTWAWSAAAAAAGVLGSMAWARNRHKAFEPQRLASDQSDSWRNDPKYLAELKRIEEKHRSAEYEDHSPPQGEQTHLSKEEVLCSQMSELLSDNDSAPIESLLRASTGIDFINHVDSEGKTLLAKACRWCHPNVIKALVQHGANTTKGSGSGNMLPLEIYLACSRDGVDLCVATLLSRNLDDSVVAPLLIKYADRFSSAGGFYSSIIDRLSNITSDLLQRCIAIAQSPQAFYMIHLLLQAYMTELGTVFDQHTLGHLFMNSPYKKELWGKVAQEQQLVIARKVFTDEDGGGLISTKKDMNDEQLRVCFIKNFALYLTAVDNYTFVQKLWERAPCDVAKIKQAINDHDLNVDFVYKVHGFSTSLFDRACHLGNAELIRLMINDFVADCDQAIQDDEGTWYPIERYCASVKAPVDSELLKLFISKMSTLSMRRTLRKDCSTIEYKQLLWGVVPEERKKVIAAEALSDTQGKTPEELVADYEKKHSLVTKNDDRA